MIMLRITSLIFALLVSWNACAQIPLTGAGKGAPGGGTAFGLSFITKQTVITPGVNQCDFGTSSIGAADTTRQVIFAFGWRTVTSSIINSVTIGGVSASQISGANAALTNGTGSTIWIASVPSGTTASIVANFSNTVVHCDSAVYRLVGTTASANGGNATTSAGATVYSSTGLSVTTGGGAVGTAYAVGGPTSVSGTNLTIDVNEAVGANFYGAGNNTTAIGTTTFTFTFNSSSGGSAAWATLAP